MKWTPEDRLVLILILVATFAFWIAAGHWKDDQSLQIVFVILLFSGPTFVAHVNIKHTWFDKGRNSVAQGSIKDVEKALMKTGNTFFKMSGYGIAKMKNPSENQVMFCSEAITNGRFPVIGFYQYKNGQWHKL